jgi:hypothetical protein
MKSAIWSARLGLALVLCCLLAVAAAAQSTRDSLPIQLLVEVRDAKTNAPVQGARVEFFSLDGKSLYAARTGIEGTRRFVSTFPSVEVPLSTLRAGIRINVKAEGFVDVVARDVGASFLAPSPDEKLFYVPMVNEDDNDNREVWADFEKATAALHARYVTWRAQAAELKTLTERINQATQSLVSDVNDTNTTTKAINELGAQCQQVGTAAVKMEIAATNAARSELAISDSLDRALRLADRCTTAADAAAINQQYNQAIRDTADLGRVDREAAQWLQGATVQGALDLPQAIGVERARLASLSESATKSLTAIRADHARAVALFSEVYSGLGIQRELIALRNKWGATFDPVAGHTHDALTRTHKSQLDAIAAGPWDQPREPEADNLRVAIVTVSHIQQESANAGKVATNVGSCTPKLMSSMSSYRSLIADSLAGATIEIAAAGGLPGKAAACGGANPGCQSLLNGVRASLERGEFTSVESSIQQARGRSCDVTAATEELEYFRTVRDAAAAIDRSANACTFNEAIAFADRFPESIRQRDMVRRAITRARDGQTAMTQIADVLRRAKAAASAGDATTARSLITSAVRDAQAWTCLGSLVDAEVKGITFTDKKTDTPVGPVAPGTLTRVEPTWVKPNVKNVGGGGSTEYIYSATTAERAERFPAHDGGDLIIKWQFSVPSTLTPGKEFEITVTGSATATQAGRALQPPAAAGVTARGVKEVKVEPMYINVGSVVRPGVFKYLVPLDAKDVTIEIGADYNLGTFAIYKFKAQ